MENDDMDAIETLKSKGWYGETKITMHYPIGYLRHEPTGYQISVYKPISRFKRIMLKWAFGLKYERIRQ